VNDPAWYANTGDLAEVSSFAVAGRPASRQAKSPVCSTHSMLTGADPVGAANRMRAWVIPDQGPPAPYPWWFNHAEPRALPGNTERGTNLPRIR